MTNKGREYRKDILDKKRTDLVSSIFRKSSEIDILYKADPNLGFQKKWTLDL